MTPRRTFLKTSAAAGVSLGLGSLFSGRLPAVSADEAVVAPDLVRFHPDIEPLVRFLEETPRDRVIEETAHRIKTGTNSYREILAALFLAGVRGIQPRPVGFKFHAVLVVNSAHLASIASPARDRWLPILWAVDQYKASQDADIRAGDWTMAGVEEAALPDSSRARDAFISAMDRWDESAADAAVAALARTASAGELFELFARYGCRDFRDIGHKAIYVANSFRCLEVIGWQHAEPVLRSLAYALLDRSGDGGNPADADFAADRPFRANLKALEDIRPHWDSGRLDAGATAELLECFRAGTSEDASSLAVSQLNAGVSPRSLFDAMFCGAGEMLMRAPGILALHAVTTTNAIRYSWQRASENETRKLLLLQNAAFLPLFRRGGSESGIRIDELLPAEGESETGATIDGIFADISGNPLSASRKILAYLKGEKTPREFARRARELIFLKGTNSHDYKFSSAVLEDYEQLSPPWRDQLLAASAFSLRGSGDKDSSLAERCRSALSDA